MTIHSRAMRCPACSYCDAMSGLNTAGSPEPGDATLCLNCGLVMILTVFGVRRPEPAELAEILAVPTVTESIAHIQRRGFIPGYRR